MCDVEGERVTTMISQCQAGIKLAITNVEVHFGAHMCMTGVFRCTVKLSSCVVHSDDPGV